MTYLLFPGRHHTLTKFQAEYLASVVGCDPATLRDINGQPLPQTEPIQKVVWAITSANHNNTRRNPLSANRREVAIEDFSSDLQIESLIFAIDDLGNNGRFAEYVLKKIEVESRGKLRMTPENTIVGCSTPAVIAMYERLGFRILPFELTDRSALMFAAKTPWECVQEIFTGDAATSWRTQPAFRELLAPATQRLFLKYDFGDLIADLFRHPFLSADGDLTETRDYNTYVRSFDTGAERKYDLIKDYVQPGRIVDIGCCTGSLIRQLTLDDRLRESDFYGIEVARRLFQECLHRKEQGAFANDNVFFYQRNAAERTIFAPNSINTLTTFALTHELESYQGRAALTKFIELIHSQLALGGRWLNVDVVGPENKDEIIYLRLNCDDGSNEDSLGELQGISRDGCRAALERMSTYARFRRFQKDFRHAEGYQLAAETEVIDGTKYLRLRLQDACEFLSKKDYVDNWQSEMHETFCYWSFTDWCQTLEHAGFAIHPASHAFCNPWIVENRYRDKVELFRKFGNRLEPMPFPVTNMLLIADKQ